MRKMNFNSLHLKGWKTRSIKLAVLSCFMIFFVGLQSASAQYLSSKEAMVVIKKEIRVMQENVPESPATRGATPAVRAHYMKISYLKHTFKKLANDLSVGAAITEVGDKLVAKTPQDASEINAIRSQIDELLRL